MASSSARKLAAVAAASGRRTWRRSTAVLNLPASAMRFDGCSSPSAAPTLLSSTVSAHAATLGLKISSAGRGGAPGRLRNSSSCVEIARAVSMSGSATRPSAALVDCTGRRGGEGDAGRSEQATPSYPAHSNGVADEGIAIRLSLESKGGGLELGAGGLGCIACRLHATLSSGEQVLGGRVWQRAQRRRLVADDLRRPRRREEAGHARAAVAAALRKAPHHAPS